MKLGIVTIQKNRSQWLAEWVAFHYLVGFRKFYIYLHDCSDESAHVVLNLARLYDIQAATVPTDTFRPQLVAYQHAYDTYSHEVDWMAFIDGDEFLFPTRCMDMRDALQFYRYKKISAIGVYWKMFGSSGHIDEPAGLITENFRMCTGDDFPENRHIKSIVRGGQFINATLNAHILFPPWGTVDERLRPVDKGWMKEYEPSYDVFRINHYTCQSLSFFENIKKYSGAADAGKNMVRADENFYKTTNASTFFDNSVEKYSRNLQLAVDEFTNYCTKVH